MMSSMPSVSSCGRGCSPSTSGRGLTAHSSRRHTESFRSQHRRYKIQCSAGKDDGGGFFGGLAKMLGGGVRGGSSTGSSTGSSSGTATAPAPSPTSSTSNSQSQRESGQPGSSAQPAEPQEGGRVKTVPEERSTVDSILTAPSTAKPEFPPYSVIQKGPVYSLRLYSVYPVVEMAYSNRGDGYASLGSYFDGQNSENAKFAYTQPVVMRYEPGGRKSMAMFVGGRRGVSKSTAAANPSSALAAAATAPATADIKSLPTPDDPSVRLAVAGGELVAVHVFEGNITPETAAAARARLVAELQKDGIQLAEEEQAGYYRVGQYGAVYQLGGRLNEVQLRVRP